MDEEKLNISPPLYLVGKKIYCWKCQEKMSVVALLAPNILGTEGEVYILSQILELPNEVLEFIQSRVPTFKYKYSKTVNENYYANTCPKCNMLSGDFFLHSEPGGPFFPTEENEAKSLYITEIPISKTISINASFHMGTGDQILNNAKKIA